MSDERQDPPVRRTQEERSRETIERLRAATLEVIAERGYGATSTTEVARRAGLSRGALLHHYPRKIDLISDVADHVWKRATDNLRRIAGCLGDDREAVSLFIDDMWGTVFREEAARMTVELVSAAHADPELRARIEGPLEALFSDYEKAALEAFGAAGRNLSQPQRLAFVHVATCTLRGLRVQEMMRNDPEMIRTVLETLVDLLVTTLAAERREEARRSAG